LLSLLLKNKSFSGTYCSIFKDHLSFFSDYFIITIQALNVKVFYEFLAPEKPLCFSDDN
jgi:hypothetical protein